MTMPNVNIQHLVNFVQQEARRARHFGELEQLAEWVQSIENSMAAKTARIATMESDAETALDREEGTPARGCPQGMQTAHPAVRAEPSTSRRSAMRR